MIMTDKFKLKFAMLVICIGCYVVDIVPTIVLLIALYNTSVYDEFRRLILGILVIFMLMISIPLSKLATRAWRSFKQL